MGWLGGILSGYADRQHEIRQENALRDEENAKREAAIYSTLLNHDDPKIQGMAATGLFELAQGRKPASGLAGWMGKMESSPVFPVLMKYMQTPQAKTVETGPAGLPSRQTLGGMPLPQGGESGMQSRTVPAAVAATATQVPPGQADQTDPNLAQPATSPTAGGAMTAPTPLPGAAGTPPPEPPASMTTDDAGRLSFTEQPTVVTATPPPLPPSILSTRQVAGAPAPTRTTWETPHFPTDEERATAAALGKDKAEFLSLVEAGRRSGQPNPEKWAADIIASEKMKAHGVGTEFRIVPGETVLPDGTVKPMTALISPATGHAQDLQGNPLTNFRPRTPAASMLDYGDPVETAAQELFHTRFALVPDEYKASVVARSNELIKASATARAAGGVEARSTWTPQQALAQARATLPKATVEQQLELAEALMRSKIPPPVEATAPAAAAPGATPAPGAAAPAATPTATGAAPKVTSHYDPQQGWMIDIPDGSPTAAASPVTTYNSLVTPGTVGGVLGPGGATGTARGALGASRAAAPAGGFPTASASPGGAAAPPAAPPGRGGFAASVLANLPPGAGGESKTTGEPMPPMLERMRAQAESTNQLIDRALAALDPYKNNNNPAAALQLAQKYRQGIFDPIDSQTEQLADLAGLQAASNTQLSGGGSRALQFMMQRRLHTPLLPSARQTEFYSFGAPSGVIGSVSRLIKSDEGTFDTPQMMYNKLLQIRENNQLFLDEMHKRTILNPGVSAPPPLPRGFGAPTPRP